MEITEIKKQLPIEQVLHHYGIGIDKNNRVCCPFHKDKTPSMQIYPKSNTYCCFSANCKANTGDQIQFIELKENKGKHHAIEKAKELIGVSNINTTHQPTINMDNQPKSTIASTNFNQVFKRLQTNIIKSTKARAYLTQRNIDIEQIPVGYNAGRTLDKLKFCVIFPLKDENNKIVSLYGRSIYDNPDKRHFYLKDREGLYPNYPHKQAQIIIITESIIDATTLIQYRSTLELKNFEILALYGTEGLTTEHFNAIQQLNGLREIILWLNGDEAGQQATQNHAKTLSPLADTISTVTLPKDEDINSLMLGHESTILNYLINQRTNLYQNNSKLLLSSEKENDATNNNKQVAKYQQGKLNTENLECITYEIDDLHFTLLGGINLTQVDRMKTTLKTRTFPNHNPLQQHRDNVDLYSDRQVQTYIRKAAEKLDKGSKDVGLALSRMVEALENFRFNKIEAQKDLKPKTRVLTIEQRNKAVDFWKQEHLLIRINELIGKSGVIGEEKNRLLMFACYLSRLMDNPLHIISLGASGTGKTYLQEKIAELVPEQDKLEITNLSDNALYYFGQSELKHKLIIIEDLDGAENVMYAIRELMSKQTISKTVTSKDAKGNMRTLTFKVDGPACFAATTTKERLYEDNSNRSLLIYRDTSKAHQQKVMDYQRKLSAGKINMVEEQQIKEFFKDLQMVLKNIQVRNPYAEQLIIPEKCFKKLRTNAHYLKFIEVITFMHQYQRGVKTDPITNQKYIETNLDDIKQANTLIKDVLLAKADELTGACRNFLEQLKTFLNQEGKSSFYKHEVREHFRINPHNLKHYLHQLITYNYVKIIGGNRYKKGYEYEITNKDEYIQLNNHVDNALDVVLKNIHQSVGNVANSG